MSGAARSPRGHPVAPKVVLQPRPLWLGEKPCDFGVADSSGVSVTSTARGDQALLRATVHEAASLDDACLVAATRHAHLRLGRMLDEQHLHAWRFWNYVPGILAPARLAENRYQVFNSARFDALRCWYGERLDDRLVAATAVGHDDADLVIDLLAGPSLARAVENSRQISPLHYSARWGPRPPCFARGVLVAVTEPGFERRRLALVSGTASIVGEDSQHLGVPSGQIQETLTNLAVLLEQIERAARARATFTSLRAYLAPGMAAADVARQASKAFSAAIETVPAHLCRPGLLVEIEGVAGIDG